VNNSITDSHSNEYEFSWGGCGVDKVWSRNGREGINGDISFYKESIYSEFTVSLHFLNTDGISKIIDQAANIVLFFDFSFYCLAGVNNSTVIPAAEVETN